MARRRSKNRTASADQVTALIARMSDSDYARHLAERDQFYFTFRGSKGLAEARRRQVQNGEI